MTREDAIKIFNTVLCLGKCDCPKDEIEECLKMAIKALAQQPSEDEKVIRIKKGTLKVRTGRYVIYDVEWLKTHFNTTEAKIYGQPKTEGTRGDIPLQQSIPKMPQPEKHTEERTETHECDYISRMTEEERELTISYLEDMKEEYVEGEGNERYPLPEWYMLDKVIKIISQQPKTGRWITQWNVVHQKEYYYCSECREEFSYDGETGIKMNDYKYCPNCGARMKG